MRTLRFFMYNNTVPLVLGVLFMGSGIAFAATNPDALVSGQQEVVSVDNTYIANKDLSTYTPQIQITGVTEDADAYYVAYTMSTIDLQEYAWKDATKSESMTVSKAELKGGDLGLFVTDRLKNVVSNELTYLQQVQEKEKQHVTQATVATTYSGLVGKFLTTKTETLPDYTPVVATEVQAVAETQPAGVAIAPTPSSDVSSSPSTQSSSGTLTLQVLGNNPAQISVGTSYVDLGAVITDPADYNASYNTYLDGSLTASPIIDTSKPGTYTIEYRARDKNGNTASLSRTIIVGASPTILLAPSTQP